MSLSGPAHRAGPDLPARPMSTFPLGGRRVRRSGYGAMHLAGPWAVNPPADRASALDAGLVDALTLHLAPIVLGAGTPLFTGGAPRTLVQRSVISTSTATHLTYDVFR